MNLRRVYIKRSGGEIASEACYAAWKGFSAKGYPLDFFEWQDLQERCLVLDAKTLVVGGTKTVHSALQQIGIEPPAPLNLPEPLTCFAKRRIWETTLGAVRAQFTTGSSSPCFIKPLADTKSFPGFVVSADSDLGLVTHLADKTMLQASDPLKFESEWRYFVHNGTVVELAHYAGKWTLVPDPFVVETAVAAYETAPAAYAIDFGVTDSGDTVLVEANDAFALGAHGIDPLVFSSMLVKRECQRKIQIAPNVPASSSQAQKTSGQGLTQVPNI